MKKNILLLATILFTQLSFSQLYNIAVIVSNDVNVRSEPSLSSKIISKAKLWERVEVIDTDEKEYQLDEDREFYYNWYHVQLENGIEGWVYGQYVYTHQGSIEKYTIAINGNNYLLLTFKEPAISHDEPGSDQNKIPLFYNAKKKRFYPIIYQYSKILSGAIYRDEPLGDYFRLVSNTGGSDYVMLDKSITVGKSERFKVNYGAGYQVGSCSAELVIVYENGQFYLDDVVNYKVSNPFEN